MAACCVSSPAYSLPIGGRGHLFATEHKRLVRVDAREVGLATEKRKDTAEYVSHSV